MCVTCGCSDPKLSHEHNHDHNHDHDHAHGAHAHTMKQRTPRAVRTTLQLERALLGKNQRLADQNRAWLAARSCLAFNLMGSPGAGKTALLEAIVRFLPDLSIAVIEGDQATERDAERIRNAGCRAIQINTGTGCHLDAHAVLHGLEALAPEPGSRVILENVGNLVCPALFDLGEAARIVVLSVTEGDDKPLKYPHMFRACDALVLNKIDLLPYVQFDVETALSHARAQNPKLITFELSATRGDGLPALCAWLGSFTQAVAKPHPDPVEAQNGAIP
ncbi:MAG TPA: hydrogenase nickel incorporation protein HypB [Polyangiaceae bacterium]|nr:hydrogenase nickel incorporation protein HypB [Polyangiaceae bacterium]